MKNEEIYKSHAERFEAFKVWAKNNIRDVSAETFSQWLLLEGKISVPKKCPFCGHAGIVDASQSSSQSQMHCLNCGAMGPVSWTKNEAIDRWNSVVGPMNLK